ncbi:MAG TPA: Hsp70 family protein [Kofleriaceae bacterium]
MRLSLTAPVRNFMTLLRALSVAALFAGCSQRASPPSEVDPSEIKIQPLPASGAGIKFKNGKEMSKAELDQIFAQADSMMKAQAAAPKPAVAGDALDAPAPEGTLPVSISIETWGGVASTMFARGTKLPAEHTETFSTATDNQTSVEVNVVQGERPQAANDRALGKFQLTGIPAAPRGIPQIDVRFSLDARGELTVTAYDRATKQEKHVTISGRQSANFPDAIDQLLADARKHRAEDVAAQAITDARTRLDNLTRSAKMLVTDSRDRLTPELLNEADSAIAIGEALLAQDTTTLQLAKVQSAFEHLKTANSDAATYLYSHSPPMK